MSVARAISQHHTESPAVLVFGNEHDECVESALALLLPTLCFLSGYADDIERSSTPEAEKRDAATQHRMHARIAYSAL